MKRLHKSLISLIVLLALPSLAYSAPFKIRVGVLPVISNTVVQIAQDEGYFRDQGLDVELVPLRGVNEVWPLLLKGDLDVASPSMSASLFNGVAGSGQVKAVLPLTVTSVRPETFAAFVVRKADLVSGRYSKPAAWKGAKIAIQAGSTLSSPLGFALIKYLQTGGLTEKDITMVAVDNAVQGDALVSGQIDISLIGEPWVTRMEDKAEVATLMSVEPLIKDITYSVLVFGPRLLADRDTAVRFSVAFIKAARQYLEGKTPHNVAIVSKLTGLDEVLVKKMGWSTTVPDARINLKSIQDYQSWLLGRGEIDRILTPQELVDPSFAQEALKILDAKK